MIRMIKSELAKIWRGKTFWIIIVIGISINLGYMQFGQKMGTMFNQYEQEEIDDDIISPSAYKKFDIELTGKKEKAEFIENYYKDVMGLAMIEEVQNYQASDSELSNKMAEQIMKENADEYAKYLTKWKEKDYKLYTDNILDEEKFAKEIYEKYYQTKDYGGYLEKILEQEEEKLGISIFSNSENKDNFSEKVIRKTAQKYKKLYGIETDFYSYKWVEVLTSNDVPDILILLILFIISMHLIFEEKKKNLFSIIRATPRGRESCMISKMVAVFISTFGVALIMYGITVIYICVNYGMSGLNGTIQSVSQFISCPYHLRIWEFFLIFFFIKCIVYFVIALLILFVSLLSANYMVPFSVGIVFVLINILMYFNFSTVGKYNIIHFLNMWSNIKFENILGDYVLLNVKDSPVSVINLILAILFFLACVLVLGNIILFKQFKKVPQYSIKLKMKKVNWNFIAKTKRIYNRLFAYEAYKIYIISGCILVIAIFAFVMIISGKNTNCYLTPNQMSYKLQMQELEGELTDEKREIVLEKKKYYDDILKQLGQLEKQYEQGKLGEEQYENIKLSLEGKLSLYSAFQRVYERYEYVNSHPNAKLVYEDGYKKLIGKMDNWYMNWLFLMLIVLIIIQSTVFTLDKERGMEKLIRATIKGRKNVTLSKMTIGITNTIIVYLCFVLRNLYISNKFYGTNMWSASLCNIKGFENVPALIPIGGAVVLIGIAVLALLILFSIGIMFLAKKVGNAIGAIVIEAIVVVVIYLMINI